MKTGKRTLLITTMLLVAAGMVTAAILNKPPRISYGGSPYTASIHP